MIFEVCPFCGGEMRIERIKRTDQYWENDCSSPGCLIIDVFLDGRIEGRPYRNSPVLHSKEEILRAAKLMSFQ